MSQAEGDQIVVAQVPIDAMNSTENSKYEGDGSEGARLLIAGSTVDSGRPIMIGDRRPKSRVDYAFWSLWVRLLVNSSKRCSRYSLRVSCKELSESAIYNLSQIGYNLEQRTSEPLPMDSCQRV